MQRLQEKIQDYSDKELLKQYYHHSSEYTPEALSVMQQEIARRNIDEDAIRQQLTDPQEMSGQERALRNNPEDFIEFQHSFIKADILLAYTILTDHEVVFFIDKKETQEDAEDETDTPILFVIKVHKDYVEAAEKALEEHFIVEGECYALKHQGVKDRLKAFNFHDVQISQKAAMEQLEVTFSPSETNSIISLGKRLLEEADEIEQSQQRVIFHYDTIEELVEKLEQSDNYTLCRAELLAILEIAQVYCDDPDFPHSMEETASSLLSFFLDI
ncbi:hypothetical protein QA601_00405 [Chitinispirillales bacterium ANBcel5]|uniref:hypothetical protein n=1 Tax=Cellulosispirillum alkaliphilum TaxID=3039283 RepID=UPI002A54E2A6|nr:hypothetical protein [Chitinispirillales bacterium ANBcel5]